MDPNLPRCTPSNALKARENRTCTKEECVTASIGALMMGLHDAGLYPAPACPESMGRSLKWYRQKLCDLGSGVKGWKPCNKTGRGHWSPYSFDLCIRPFPVAQVAGEVLKRHLCIDVIDPPQHTI